MRTLITWLVLAVLAAAFGCASSRETKPAATPDSQTGKAGSNHACVMPSGGRGALRLAVSPDATCTAEDGLLHLKSQNLQVNIWLVRDVQTVDEAIGRVGQVIDSEFKEFKTTSTTPMTIAGAPATRLLGSGVEADDNDPGTADVVVFKVGPRVFVACTHEEHLSPVAQQWMLTMLRTAQQP